MITVNLLPGSAKKSTSRDFNISGMVSGAASSISDKYLIACVGTVSATVLAVGFLCFLHLWGWHVANLGAKEIVGFGDVRREVAE